MKRTLLCFVLGILALGLAAAANPPELVNYQGVLRDAGNNPLSGNYDMVLTLYSADTGGDQILIDSHTLAAGGQVTVSGGLFNVQLGSGTVTDGSGPGSYTSLAQVFRDYGAVYLEVRVGSETLSPRTRIVSSAYALNSTNATNATNAVNATNAANASTLGGLPASNFLDTSSTAQTKSGPLTVDVPGTSTVGFTGLGTYGGGFFRNSLNPQSYAWLGRVDRGMETASTELAASFSNYDFSGYAYLAYRDRGIEAVGNEYGGYFKDLNSSGYAIVGVGDGGIAAHGNSYGGYFKDEDNSGYAFVGYSELGIDARGNTAGGYFKDANSSGYASVGYGNQGIHAEGNEAGGYFKDADHSGYASVGSGDYGILAEGNGAGGYFKDLNSTSYAYIGYDYAGVSAYGTVGVTGIGRDDGGYFANTDSGRAWVGAGDVAIMAFGNQAGGQFHDSDGTAYAEVAAWDVGVYAAGNAGGGSFLDGDNGTTATLASNGVTVGGNGTKPFMQNHPYEKDKTVVYNALEGNEVGTYTRGTARLTGGAAKVALDQSFAWVTNPDIGLTATVTPRGECRGLYVESLTTQEMIVREIGGGGSDVVFDYVVQGLRIGFEEMPVVQEKSVEMFIPSMREYRQLYERRPELRAYNALERFKAMQGVAGLASTDSTRADALKAAIHEYDPGTDPPACKLLGMGPCPEDPPALPEKPLAPSTALVGALGEAGRGTGAAASTPQVAHPAPPVAQPTGIPAESAPLLAAPLLPVDGPVEAGDLLVLDPQAPGRLKRCDATADGGVVGIALGEVMSGKDGALEAPVAGSGFVSVKADASYGAIRPGDLLVSSVTPGHAMKAPEGIVAGTVIGKALEPLESGTGLIKVLVMPR